MPLAEDWATFWHPASSLTLPKHLWDHCRSLTARGVSAGVSGTLQTTEDEGSTSQGSEAVASLAWSVNSDLSSLLGAKDQKLCCCIATLLYQPGSHLRPAQFGSKLPKITGKGTLCDCSQPYAQSIPTYHLQVYLLVSLHVPAGGVMAGGKIPPGAKHEGPFAGF